MMGCGVKLLFDIYGKGVEDSLNDLVFFGGRLFDSLGNFYCNFEFVNR